MYFALKSILRNSGSEKEERKSGTGHFFHLEIELGYCILPWQRKKQIAELCEVSGFTTNRLLENEISRGLFPRLDVIRTRARRVTGFSISGIMLKFARSRSKSLTARQRGEQGGPPCDVPTGESTKRKHDSSQCKDRKLQGLYRPPRSEKRSKKNEFSLRSPLHYSLPVKWKRNSVRVPDRIVVEKIERSRTGGFGEYAFSYRVMYKRCRFRGRAGIKIFSSGTRRELVMGVTFKFKRHFESFPVILFLKISLC